MYNEGCVAALDKGFLFVMPFYCRHNMDTHCILVVVTLLWLGGMFVNLFKMWG